MTTSPSQSYEQGLGKLRAPESRNHLWASLLPLLDQHPEQWAETARAIEDNDLAYLIHDYNLTQRLWHCVAGNTALPQAQWEQGAEALLNVLVGNWVVHEFAQERMGDSGHPLEAARAMGMLERFCRRHGGDAEVEDFWRFAGGQLLGWIMKVDDVTALDELMRHAKPDQGLDDGGTSWVQAWVQQRGSIPYIRDNAHAAMLDRLVAWGVNVDRTHTNQTTLELAAQDNAFGERGKETIDALISAGADWTVLERNGGGSGDVDFENEVKRWVSEHPVVRRARLGGLANEGQGKRAARKI